MKATTIKSGFLLVACLSALAPMLSANEAVTVFLPDPPGCYFSGKFNQKKQLDGIETIFESTGIFLSDCNAGVIWQTDTPHQEVLMLARQKKPGKLENNKIETLKSRASQLISKTITSLMNSDEDFINKRFKVKKSANNKAGTTEFTLKPKRKRLSKALTQITISYQQDIQSMAVSVITKSGETTLINAQVSDVHSKPFSTSTCVELGIEQLACSALELEMQ